MRNRRRTRKFSHKISDHFSKRDFECHSGADSFRLSLGLIGGLELLRSLARNRITIIKGYEDPEASPNPSKINRNYHTMGLAADIKVEQTDAKTAFKLAEEVPEFMGIGLNVDDNYIHVDTRKTDERQLWIEHNGTILELTDTLRQEYGL